MNTLDTNNLSNEQLLELYKKQASRITELEKQVESLMEHIRLQQHRQFRPSSEKTSDDQVQLSLFNEVEENAQPDAPEPTVETITYTRTKAVGEREAKYRDLPVKRIDHALPEDQRTCQHCSNPLEEMSQQVRQEIRIVPAVVELVEHVQHTYVCKCCNDQGLKATIVKAPMPVPPFPKSMASAEAVAFVINSKYNQATPLYRISRGLEEIGIEISRQTLCNWVLQSAQWFEPLYEQMHQHLLKRDILHADETTLQVLKEPDRSAENKSYIWLYRTGREGPPIVLYEYQQTRNADHPKAFLSGFQGYLHVDGYQAYQSLPGVTPVGCWAHARRGFSDALKGMPKIKAAKGKKSPAEEGFAFCNRLFEIERALAALSSDERKAQREALSAPLLVKFRQWLDEKSLITTPKSLLGKAIGYCINQWSRLNAFLQDGRLELDNNRAERSIKPFVIGRKNWLFSDTPRGAKTSALLYSIIETAKENGLSPLKYLTHVLKTMPNITTSQISSLLPWADDLPAECRMKGPG